MQRRRASVLERRRGEVCSQGAQQAVIDLVTLSDIFLRPMFPRCYDRTLAL